MILNCNFETTYYLKVKFLLFIMNRAYIHRNRRIILRFPAFSFNLLPLSERPVPYQRKLLKGYRPAWISATILYRSFRSFSIPVRSLAEMKMHGVFSCVQVLRFGRERVRVLLEDDVIVMPVQDVETRLRSLRVLRQVPVRMGQHRDPAGIPCRLRPAPDQEGQVVAVGMAVADKQEVQVFRIHRIFLSAALTGPGSHRS